MCSATMKQKNKTWIIKKDDFIAYFSHTTSVLVHVVWLLLTNGPVPMSLKIEKIPLRIKCRSPLIFGGVRVAKVFSMMCFVYFCLCFRHFLSLLFLPWHCEWSVCFRLMSMKYAFGIFRISCEKAFFLKYGIMRFSF